MIILYTKQPEISGGKGGGGYVIGKAFYYV